jgi:H+/Cl- antiporter ClcA
LPSKGIDLHKLLAPLVIAVCAAAACAVFAFGLEKITSYHEQNPLLALLLPAILWFTRLSDPAFTNGLARRLKTSAQTISGLFLIPLCWLSHLGGASVGRESVAVHAGRSIASFVASFMTRQNHADFDSVIEKQVRQGLLRTGIAAGFAALFGAPLSALVFAYEWTPAEEVQNSVKENAGEHFSAAHIGMTAFAAALSYILSTRLFGVVHNHFRIERHPFNQTWFIFICILSLCALLVSFIHHSAGHLFGRFFSLFDRRPVMRVLIPSMLLVLIFHLPETQKYKGLGVQLIHNSLSAGPAASVDVFEPLLKSLLTSFSLAAGFRGGEVTPLLAVGASLGTVLGSVLGVSSQAAAAAGFPLIFAILFRVPLCGLILTMEIFGFQQSLLTALPLMIFMLLKKVLK